jgi:hypothetical protein
MIAELSVAASELSALLLGWALTYLIHSTLLLGGLWLLASRGIGSWSVRDILWKVAVVGGILTATIQSVVAWWPGAELRPAMTAGGDSGRGESNPGVEASPEPGSPAARRGLDAPGAGLALPRRYQIHLGLDGDSPTARTTSDGQVPIRWTVWFLVAWGVGVSIGLLAMVWARVRLRRLLRGRSMVTDPSLQAMLGDLCRRAGVRRTVLLTKTERLQTPFAMGAGEICLPIRVVRGLDGEQQRSILAHELAHLLRRDPGWFTCLALIERVLFFQPLIRVARREVQEGAELLCDDWAAGQVGGLALARCIAEVASWNAAPPRAFAMARMSGSGPLTRRVDRLLSHSTTADRAGHRVWVGVAGGLVTLVMACAPGVTVRDARSEVAVHAQDGSGMADAVTDSSGPPDAIVGAAQQTETPEAVVSIGADGTILYGMESSDEVRTVAWAHGPFWQNAAQLEGQIRFESQGRITFSADGTEIVDLSAGARFVVEETDTSGVRRLEVSRDADDAVHYSYSVNGQPEPWSSPRERRGWLGPLVRELIRISTPGADTTL